MILVLLGLVLWDDAGIVTGDDVAAGRERYGPSVHLRFVTLRRWLRSIGPERIDWLVAGLLLIAFELEIWTGTLRSGRPVAAVAAIVPCAAVAVRRRWLIEVLALGLITSAAKLLAGGPRSAGGGVGVICVMLIFYAAGAFYSGRRSWCALGLGIAVTAIANVNASGSLLVNLVFGLGIAVAPPFLLGRIARDHAARERAGRVRAERLDSERELNVRNAALAERTRLAREIHDVIAHSVSVMVIQSAGARTVMAADQDRAEEALKAVERAGREALAELRRLLGVLGDARSLRELAPQPGLDDLEELVARTSSSEVKASFVIEGRPVTVSPGLSLCAYRVVQEALTNTIKHAGPAHAQVAVRWQATGLELEVVDDGTGDRGAWPETNGGHGIAGMRERVELHGGNVVAGPVDAGGFAVRASIPLLTQDAS
jgi:signal transduction histidine kinase